MLLIGKPEEHIDNPFSRWYFPAFPKIIISVYYSREIRGIP